MKITIARSADLDGLYIDGILAKTAHSIDIDDVVIIAGKQAFTLSKKYLNEEWVTLSGYQLPMFEVNLVELDS